MLSQCGLYYYCLCNEVPYVGKFWRVKILANGVQFTKFFHANSYKCSEITEDLPADSPKFSSPFASSVMIRQNFLPPKFSHVRYTISVTDSLVCIVVLVYCFCLLFFSR